MTFLSVKNSLRSLSLLCAGCALVFTLVPGASAGSDKHHLQAQGSALFADKGCSHCHGPAGFGGSDSGPDLSHVRSELKGPEIAQQIHDGGKNMPPFGDALSNDEIAALVEYLRSKRKAPAGFHPPGASSPAAATAPAPQAKPDPD